MKVFIIQSAEQVSNNYHSDGGIMVVAETPEEALQLANATPGVSITAQEMASAVTLDVFKTSAKKLEQKVFVFPDAGCC